MIRSLAAVLAALEFVAPKFEQAHEASAHVRRELGTRFAKRR